MATTRTPNDIRMSSQSFTSQQIWLLLLAALVFRLAYLGLVLIFDGQIDNGSDSGKYLQLATNINAYGSLLNWDLGQFGPDTGRMPLYPYFLALVLEITGPERLWGVAVLQALIDTTTVIAIGLIAGAMKGAWALPSAILACGWATLIVLSSFVLADTVFMAFFCWGICACMWAPGSKQKLILVTLAGIAFSLALLTRPTLMFFPYVLAPALSLLLWARGNVPWRKAILFSLLPAFMMLLAVVPRATQNYTHYGEAVITTQSGDHALDVVDQFIRLCDVCIRQHWEQRMHTEARTLFSAQNEKDRKNPVVLDNINRDVALRHLKELPLTIIVKGVTLGSLRSILQTSLYETGHQFHLQPKFFSSIHGERLLERLRIFFSEVVSSTFLLVWAFAQMFAIAAFFLQILGLRNSVRDRETAPYVLFLITTGLYFLAVNGPFGNPRYGIPLTPVLIVLTASGIVTLKNWFKNRKTRLT